MNKLLSCEFNIDTGNVECRFADGTMISIDCDVVEDTIDGTLPFVRVRTELDWLIYNAPREYVQLVLNGGLNPLNFWIGGYKLSAREFQWSSRTPKQQKKPILRSITCTSGLASGLLLPFPWSRAQSLCLPSGILSGIFSRPVCCGFWPMCCLRRTTNRRC